MKYVWSIGLAACLVVASAVVAHNVRRQAVPSSPNRVSPPAPRSSDETDALRTEIAVLRAERDRLRQESERTRQLESQVRDAPAAPTRLNPLDEAGRKQEIPSEEFDAPLNVRNAAEAADLLRLDSARASLFITAVESLDTQVRAIEAQRAKVCVEGDTTRIEIPAFLDEVEVLMRSWSDRLDTLLTAAEKEKYKKYGLNLSLIVCRNWGAKKTVTIKRSGGAMYIDELVMGIGGGSVTGTGGPDDETTLAPYLYLLPK